MPPILTTAYGLGSLLLTAFVTWLFMVVLATRARLRPPRLTALRALITLGRSGPSDLGFAAQALDLPVTYRGKQLTLKGTFVPHPKGPDHLVVLLHGFADSSAGVTAWVPLLHDCQVNVLLVDLPGHGESPDSVSTAGFFERNTVLEVVQQLRQLEPLRCRKVILFGISMGAAVALATACLPEACIAGVIADSPYADVRRAAQRHAWLFGLPGAIVQRPATWLIEHWLAIDYSQVAPARIIASPPCPVLLIQAGGDLLITPDDAMDLREQLARKGDGSRSVVIDGAAHILGLAANPDAYAHDVRLFIKSIST